MVKILLLVLVGSFLGSIGAFVEVLFPELPWLAVWAPVWFTAGYIGWHWTRIWEWVA